MSWIAVAIGGAAVVGALGSNAAANTQAGAQEQAAATQQKMFNTINGQEQPFIQSGYGAQQQLNYLLGIGDPGQAFTAGKGGVGGSAGTASSSPAGGYGSLNSTFTPADYLANQDPGYQFQLQQGAQATRNADTPGVGALSGPALKDLMSFNQGMASTGYQNAFNRFQTQNNNIFSRLSGIAGLGQNAATNVGTAGTSLGTGIAQAQAAAGGSQAAGIVGSTNALSSGATTLAGLYGYDPTAASATANSQSIFDSTPGQAATAADYGS